MHVHDVGLRIEVIVPDVLQQHRACDDLPGMPHQIFQQLELLGLQGLTWHAGIALQPQEFKLLEYLMRHAGQVVTRTMLLENVWDYHFDPQTNVVDVHISKLRQKIEIEAEPPLLRTVRNAGYMLTANE